jgi:hypothetical protein
VRKTRATLVAASKKPSVPFSTAAASVHARPSFLPAPPAPSLAPPNPRLGPHGANAAGPCVDNLLLLLLLLRTKPFCRPADTGLRSTWRRRR